MELSKDDLKEAAASIVNESGIKGLTLMALAKKLGIDYNIPFMDFKNDYDILNLLLESLDAEIKELINETGTAGLPPEEEFQLLFENVYRLFDQKPYYLPVLFNIEMNKHDAPAADLLIRIKGKLETYLLKIINQGKKDTVFKTHYKSGTLVNKILGSFRSFMSQQNMINKMAKDLKEIRGNLNYP